MKNIWFFISVCISFGSDLLSKWYVENVQEDFLSVFGEILFLTYTKNSGIAFSLPLEGISLKIITIILLFILFYYYIQQPRKEQNTLVDVSFGLLIGGAGGNAFERVIFGQVTDWIGIYNFFVCNLADIYISAGIILYVSYILLHNTKKQKNIL